MTMTPGGMASTIARDIMHPAEAVASLDSEISPSDVSEQAERTKDAVNAGRRVRKKWILIIVLSLGEIHWWTVTMSLHYFRRLTASSCLNV